VSRPHSFWMIGFIPPCADGDPLAGRRAAQQRCCAGRQPGPRGDSESVEPDAGGDQGGKRAKDREKTELPACGRPAAIRDRRCTGSQGARGPGRPVPRRARRGGWRGCAAVRRTVRPGTDEQAHRVAR